jgi:hypothetical protein
MKKATKSVRLKNFTGVVRVNPNKTVSVAGRVKAASGRRRVASALRKYLRKP